MAFYEIIEHKHK